MEIGPYVFEKSGTQTDRQTDAQLGQTDAATLYIYRRQHVTRLTI